MLHVLSESELARASDRRQRLERLGVAVAKPAVQPPPKISLERQIITAAFDLACLRYFNWCFEVAEPPPPRIITIEVIQNWVARRYHIRRDELISHRRQANLVRPRQIAMWLCKELTAKSFPDIARRFDHRDHTTIMYGYRKIEEQRKRDRMLHLELEHLVSALRPRFTQEIGNADGQDQTTD